MRLPRLRTIVLVPAGAFALFYASLVVFLLLDNEPIVPLAGEPAGQRTVVIFGASGTAGDGILKAALASRLTEQAKNLRDRNARYIADLEAGPPAQPAQEALFGVSTYYRGAYALHALRGPDAAQVPWHRVITASGRIAFESGSDSFEKQKKLLIEEDITVIAGRVDMDKYRWRPQLDELLWKPTSAWDER